MSIEKKHIAYFIGVGGIGMSAIARWFNHMGMQVFGYDRTRTPLTKELESEGINIHYEDNVELIPDEVKNNLQDTLVIYTPAIPRDHQEYNYLINQGYEVMKRSQALGFLTRNLHTVAVAGTHGKTTTSSMIAHILKDAGKNMVAFLGGVTTNYNSNLIYTGKIDVDTIAVVEADEFDRSFLQLHPDVAVVTSADADHLDIYGDKESLQSSFKDFISQVKPGGTLFINQNIEFLADHVSVKKKTYGLNKGNAQAKSIEIVKGNFIINYQNGVTEFDDIELKVPGFHNSENMVAAIAVCLELGLQPDIIKKAISSYSGVKRRFEYIIRSEEIIFIDDYAHHPVEISAFLKSVKSLYPDRKVTAVFQPHLFTRTRDFVVGFASSLDQADDIILLDIYPAREEPIPGVTSQIIFEHMQNTGKKMLEKHELLNELGNRPIDILVTVGAGDIDQLVLPIKDLLIKKYDLKI